MEIRVTLESDTVAYFCAPIIIRRSMLDNSDPAWMERLWYTGHPVDRLNLIFDIVPSFGQMFAIEDFFAGYDGMFFDPAFDLDEHINFCIAAMQTIAPELGLLPQAAPPSG